MASSASNHFYCSTISDSETDGGPHRSVADDLAIFRDGRSTHDIALQLNLSPKTIDKHRENMMRKLQVSNATQLLKNVIGLG